MLYVRQKNWKKHIYLVFAVYPSEQCQCVANSNKTSNNFGIEFFPSYHLRVCIIKLKHNTEFGKYNKFNKYNFCDVDSKTFMRNKFQFINYL